MFFAGQNLTSPKSKKYLKYMNFIYLKTLFITWMIYLDPTHLPAPSWLVSSVGRALHRYRRGHGFKSRMGLNFFQVQFSTTSSVVFFSCEDLLNSRDILHHSKNFYDHGIQESFEVRKQICDMSTLD